MTRQAIPRDRLGLLEKIGQGGQGVVYRAPGFKTKFTDAMVFKEYKPGALREINFDALEDMPGLVEDSMPYGDAERLIEIAAWPCAIVESEGKPIGQVMPAIPDRFTMEINTAKGASRVSSEIQHLLNHRSVLEARGIRIADVQRYALLRQIATELAFLHRYHICVGDISPKNLLFSLAPSEAAYFIDCDTMSINGASALPQVETPGWEVPAGEALGTIYSDSYKLGLLALRLLVGDQDVRDVQRLPRRTPDLLRKIIADALSTTPARRPLPTAWTYILAHSIEEVQQRDLDSGREEDESDGMPTPPIPVVRSRPSNGRQSTHLNRPEVAAPALPAVPPAEPYPTAPGAPVATGTTQRQNRLILFGVAAAAVLAVVIVAVMISLPSGGGSSSAPDRRTQANSYDEPTTVSSRTQTPTDDSATGTASAISGPAAAPQPSPTVVNLFPPPPTSFPVNDDPGGQGCPGGIPLGRNNLTAARGSDVTSCYFAGSVGTAYADLDPDPRVSTNVFARGAVDCRSVEGAACSGADFRMLCGMRPSERWVTCTGGNRAIVYIF